MFNKKAKELSKILFGTKASFTGHIDKNKTTTFDYSSPKEFFSKKAIWRNDDGLIQFLLERIDTLETKVAVLEKLPCKHSKK